MACELASEQACQLSKIKVVKRAVNSPTNRIGLQKSIRWHEPESVERCSDLQQPIRLELYHEEELW